MCRIFLCCHKTYDEVPPLCVPIQGGRAINPPVAGIAGDDTGENISDKNREYCELTVMYHAWKNTDFSHVGFCHYRRFFCFDEGKKPYRAVKRIGGENRRLLGTAEQIERLCGEYDIILPRAEDMGISVREHYASSAFHHAEDLALFEEIIAEKFPKLSPAAEEYLRGTKQYFCNMFIMDRQHFDEYCGYLFGILSEFDRRKTLHGSFQDDRTDGYLGERFVGIYLLYAKKRGAKIKEISRIDAGCGAGKRLGCALLPPESRRRFLAKRIVKRLKQRKGGF